MIDTNKMMISDKASCDNGKDCHYTVGYQVDEALIQLFIKTPKKYLIMACRNTRETLSIECHLMFLRQKSGCLNTKIFGRRLSRSCLKN